MIEISVIAALTALYVVLVFIGKILNDSLTPYRIDTQMTSSDNTALSLSIAGYYGAITIIFLASFIGPEPIDSLGMEIVTVGGYSMIGILLLNLSRLFNDRVILHTFNNVKEIIEDRNCGTAAVQAGSYLASALVIAGAIHGEYETYLRIPIFFVLGQVMLFIAAIYYNLITDFNLHEEVEDDNYAAGISFGGFLTAAGIIVLGALGGSLENWQIILKEFVIYSAGGLVFLTVLRLFFDIFLIPGGRLDHEIRDDRNIGVAIVESVFLISSAVLLFFLL
ncbi:MAG: DUF350 domain-containing protein [Fibrobacterota bacterium]